MKSTGATVRTSTEAGGAALFVSTAVAAGALSLLEGTYKNPLLDAVLTTAQPILAFSVAYLLFLRFSRTHRWSDLLLLHAISIFGFAQVFFNPYLGVELEGSEFSRAPVLTCYFIGAMAVAAAALVQGNRMRGTKVLALLSTSLALAIPSVASILATIHTHGSSPDVSVHQSASDFVRAGAIYVLLVAAGAGFCTIWNRSSDPFYGWLTAASAIGGFAFAPTFVAPTLESAQSEVHDILILAFLLLLFLGGQREMTLQRESYSREAAEDERRRLARELHDGITQELVFIASQGNTLLGRTSPDATDGLRWITSAAERGADEARQAILALSKQSSCSTGEAARDLAEELAHRAGMTPSLEIDLEIELDAKASKELLGILREAIANAARHGKANNVSVRLRRDNGVVLEISDNGNGFAPAAIEGRARTGFGLASMRERAHVLGGSLQISSLPSRGTKVRLRVPECTLAKVNSPR